MFSTVRGQLALWNFLIILSLLVTFSLTLYWITNRSLYLEIDVTLQAKTEALIDQLDFINGTVKFDTYSEISTTGLLIQIQDAAGNVVFEKNQTPYNLPITTADIQSEVLTNGFSWQTLHDGPTTVRLLTIEEGNDAEEKAGKERSILWVSVGTSLGQIEKKLGNLRLWLIGISSALLLITNALTLLLTGKLLRPLTVMTQSADAITEKNLEQPLPVTNSKDEIGQLGTAFNRLLKRLHAAFEGQRRFVSDASHELRTPLAILQGKLEVTLRKKRSKEEYHQVVETALNQAIRLSDLVQSLLLLARVDSGRLEIEKSPVRLDQLCKEVSDQVETLSVRKQIRLDVLANARPIILGDKELLRQALLNLVENAVKYTPEKGQVVISVDRDVGCAVITITDTGIGIAKTEIPHLFKRFYRVDKARSTRIPGTGLGLSIVNEIISIHQGTIKINSQPNKGTSVKITFPSGKSKA